METVDLEIRKHGAGTYEWQISHGNQHIKGGVEDDITACLAAAPETFVELDWLAFAVNYRGAAVGTYSASRLRVDAAQVAIEIMAMVQRL